MAGTNNPGPVNGSRLLGCGNTIQIKEHYGGTAERRKRSEAGWIVSSRSHLIVLMKTGNRNPTGPGRGKEMAWLMTRYWETQEDTQMSKDDHINNVSTKQDRIASIAKKYSDQPILSIAHHIDLEWLYVAYLKTRKDGAVGVDGKSSEEYSLELRENLKLLLDKLKTGLYQAPAVRRVYIPKGKGNETRPLGIPTFEDKLLQRAVLMALSPVWEQEFYDFSYGFRKGRSPHQALKALREKCIGMGGGWIIDLDIRKYFDSIDHSLLREIFKKRVCDGVITRVIGKWLKAGVMEDGVAHYHETGTPQGGVISPLLSNIFLHEVLDKWFVETVKSYLNGPADMVRFADDAVLIFQNKEDALRVLEVLPKRFGRYKLTLHPEKTRLVRFVTPDRDKDSGGKPETFSFLGFTLYWGKSRKGKNLIMWKTEKSRLARSIGRVKDWMKRHRHLKVKVQHKKLCQKINGHYAYFSMSFNYKSISSFFYECTKNWYKWLSRRSHKTRLNWKRFNQMLIHYPFPKPRIIHSLWSKSLT